MIDKQTQAFSATALSDLELVRLCFVKLLYVVEGVFLVYIALPAQNCSEKHISTLVLRGSFLWFHLTAFTE